MALTSKRPREDDLPELPEIDERAKVEGWRLQTLIEAGYPLWLAERVAAGEADLHIACEMLGKGCTPEMAAEILL